MDIRWEGLDDAQRRLSAAPGQIQRAKMRALRKTVKHGKTLLSREVRAELALPKKYVDERITTSVTRPGPEAGGRISAQRRGILLTRFKHSAVYKGKTSSGDRKRVGYRVKVSPSKPATVLRHVFPVPLRGGNGIGLAQRVGAGRYPIKVLHAPSVSQVFQRKRESLIAPLQDYLTRTFDAELRFELNRGNL